MKTIRFFILGSLVSIFIVSCGTTIPGGFEGLHWGAYTRVDTTVYANEFKWAWVWNDVILYDIRWKTESERVDIFSSDDLHMDVELALRLRPAPKELYYLHVEIGQDYYPEVVQQQFRSISRAVFSDYKYSEIPKKSIEIQTAILKLLRKNLEGKHIQLDAVELKHVNYPPAVKQAADFKLATEQQLEQKEFELQIAEKDAEILIIEAKGKKTAQRIIDSTLTLSYLQYRALDVQKVLAQSGNTSFYFVPIGQNGIPIIVDTGMSGKNNTPKVMEKKSKGRMSHKEYEAGMNIRE
ncbi:MAG: prohibitin family protein [Melioribacteraceae bacterium]|nr:prohibitin family protein [Melioribacteraceae bacterium]